MTSNTNLKFSRKLDLIAVVGDHILQGLSLTMIPKFEPSTLYFTAHLD